MRANRSRTYHVLACAAVLAAAVLSPPAAADPARGKLLYENHCHVCHESTVHVRENRKEHDRAGIVAQVTRWQAALKLGWSSEDIRDVTDYLAQHYYRFDSVTE